MFVVLILLILFFSFPVTTFSVEDSSILIDTLSVSRLFSSFIFGEENHVRDGAGEYRLTDLTLHRRAERLDTPQSEFRLDTLRSEHRLDTLQSEYRLDTLQSEYRLVTLHSEYRPDTLQSEYRLDTLHSEYRLDTLRSEYILDTLQSE